MPFICTWKTWGVKPFPTCVIEYQFKGFCEKKLQRESIMALSKDYIGMVQKIPSKIGH